jgi:cellulose 1,4-beta-cellobiosidase
LHANSFTPTGQYNKAQNEKLYIEAFSAELKKQGMPSQAITDTSRNGVQGLRKEWGHCEYLSEKQSHEQLSLRTPGCNVKGAGFGPRPTTST